MEKDLTQSKAEGLDLENESAESIRRTGTKLPKNRIRFHHRKNRIHPRRMV